MTAFTAISSTILMVIPPMLRPDAHFHNGGLPSLAVQTASTWFFHCAAIWVAMCSP